MERRISNNLFETGPEAVKFTGVVGERIKNTVNNRLKYIINHPLMLEGFIKKDLAFPWQRKFEDESWEGLMSYAWLGEHIGKWLHAAIVLAINTGDGELLEMVRSKADFLVDCQDKDGYLGMYDQASRFTAPYGEHSRHSWDIWVHRYNIFGLISVYKYLKDDRYLKAAAKIVRLLASVFGPEGRNITYEGTREGISALTILESVMMVYEASGNQDCLDFARHLIYNSSEEYTRVLSRLVAGEGANRVGRGKAYQLMAVMLGLLLYYRNTGDKLVLKAVQNCWKDIKYHHIHVTGGPWTTETAFLTNRECFADESYWSPFRGVENCSTVTWLQLSLLLLELTGDETYADEAEKTFYNHHLGSHTKDCSEGMYMSYINRSVMEAGKKLHCCNSSWPRAYACFSTHCYMLSGRGVTVCFYEDSVFNEKLQGEGTVSIIQTTSEMGDKKTAVFDISTQTDTAFTLAFRLPSWASEVSAELDGEPLKGKHFGGTFLEIERIWKGEHKINLSFYIRPVLMVRNYGNMKLAAFGWGPYNLSAGDIEGMEYNGLIFTAPDIRDEVTGTVDLEKVQDAHSGLQFKLKLKPPYRCKGRDYIILKPYYEAASTCSKLSTWFAL